MNMQDFYTGHAFDAYEFFGAHTYFGGTHFAVWAPSAQHIAVETEIGTFDLHRTQSAVWECDAPGVQAGMVYQYWVRGANGQSVAHCDPYGTAMTLRPDGRSIVSDAPKGFADDKWMQERTKCFDIRLFDMVNHRRVRHTTGVVHLLHIALLIIYMVGHVRYRSNHIHVKLTIQTLLHNFHVEQSEETATETKTQSQ